MTREDRIAKQATRLQRECVHFTGLQMRTCAAGVRYFASGPQPCLLDHDTGKHVCPQRRFPSADEARRRAETEVAAWTAAVDEWNTRHLAGLCVACGAPTGGLQQVGRCVYALRCGHRQYQGTVGKAGA